MKLMGYRQEAKMDEKVFLAGVNEQNGKLFTAGGRVLCN